LKCFNNHLNIK